MDARKLAELFHDTYEALAPTFGYETRTDTRRFDAETPNGRLMIAVCGTILRDLEARNADQAAQLAELQHAHDAAMRSGVEAANAKREIARLRGVVRELRRYDPVRMVCRDRDKYDEYTQRLTGERKQTANELLREIWQSCDRGEVDGIDLDWMVKCDEFFETGATGEGGEA